MIDPIVSPLTLTPDTRQFVSPGGELGKDEFLQLLVTQLRNQDPMNPSDPKDFAAQLAQFSTVEQLLNIGEQISALGANDNLLIQTINAGTAMQLLGHSVLVEGDVIDVPASGDLNVRFEVGGEGGEGEIILKDDAGIEVARVKVTSTGGPETIDLNALVGQLPPGRYTYEVAMKDANGEPVEITKFAQLRVDGVKYTPSGPVLSSGPVTIALGDVIEIIE
jgi:flagellar basal-body rod modification protein FlgD